MKKEELKGFILVDLYALEDDPNETDEVKRLEARSKEDILTLLRESGINSDAWDKSKEYKKAKTLLFEHWFIDSEIYDKQMKWVLEYLKM
jgi:hypothetical protein